MKPVDFFIIGAAKAGTTALHEYLSRHTDICMSKIKEPNFFSHEELGDHNLYYRDEIVKSPARYEELFHHRQAGQIAGEASVSYMGYTTVAAKLACYNPQAKIIVCLRDPVSRALSHHSMDEKLGFCDAPVEDIFYNPSRFPHYFFQYFSLGLYANLLRSYQAVFPPENLFLVESAELSRKASEILRFLGVDSTISLGDFPRSNEGSIPRTRWLRRLYTAHILRKTLSVTLPKNTIELIKRIALAPPSYTHEEGFYSDLTDFFHADLLALRDVFGVSLVGNVSSGAGKRA
jgi:hypothetical protein